MISLRRPVSRRVNRIGGSDDPKLIAEVCRNIMAVRARRRLLGQTARRASATRNVKGRDARKAVALRQPFWQSGSRYGRRKSTEARPPPVRFHAKHVSVGESGGEYFQVSFDNDDPSDDDLDLSLPDQPYLLVQRQFEDDDGGVCYIETLDHDSYTGHYRLRLIEFTPTRLAFEIARKDHKYVEVTFDLNAKRFSEVKRIVHIIFGVRA
jgi:hypothetical protein